MSRRQFVFDSDLFTDGHERKRQCFLYCDFVMFWRKAMSAELKGCNATSSAKSCTRHVWLVRVGKDLIETITRCLAVDHFHISGSTSCSKWWSASARRRKAGTGCARSRYLTSALDLSAEHVVFRPSPWQTKPDVSYFHLGYIAHCMWSLPHVKSVKHGSHVRIFRALLAPHVHARAHARRPIVCRAPMLFQSTLFSLKLQETPEADGTIDPHSGKRA